MASACSNCLLPNSVPDTNLDAHSVCCHCHAYAQVDHQVEDRLRRQREADLEAALEECRGKGEYDCLLNLSGGKDSCYLLPQRMHRTLFQGTSVVFFFVVNWSKVVPYAWLGQWTPDNLQTSLVLMPLAPLGIWIGRRIHLRVNDDLFFRVVHASLLVIGVKLLYDVAPL